MEEVRPRGGNNGNQYKKKESGNVSNEYIAKKRINDQHSEKGKYRRLRMAIKSGNQKAKEAYDLYKEGKITINAAMIMAELQKKQFSCLMDVDSVVNQIKNKFSKKDIRKIIDGLQAD